MSRKRYNLTFEVLLNSIFVSFSLSFHNLFLGIQSSQFGLQLGPTELLVNAQSYCWAETFQVVGPAVIMHGPVIQFPAQRK
jgi:hypothetical protein